MSATDRVGIRVWIDRASLREIDRRAAAFRSKREVIGGVLIAQALQDEPASAQVPAHVAIAAPDDFAKAALLDAFESPEVRDAIAQWLAAS